MCTKKHKPYKKAAIGDGRTVPPAERARFTERVRDGATNVQLAEDFHILPVTAQKRVRDWGLLGLRDANRIHGKSGGGSKPGERRGAAGSPYGRGRDRYHLREAVDSYWRNSQGLTGLYSVVLIRTPERLDQCR